MAEELRTVWTLLCRSAFQKPVPARYLLSLCSSLLQCEWLLNDSGGEGPLQATIRTGCDGEKSAHARTGQACEAVAHPGRMNTPD